ncbi:MAG: NAD(P)H-hydrate dehydratase [Hyphomonadaceae bacterium]|nr:NAD(P)H-hydrate dehydratase [Hyphomonadaceae bacterium]
MNDAHGIISVADMRAIDARSAALGVSTRTLMENAGAAVAASVQRRWSPRPTVVLCGPGGNGGDGFVAARKLAEAGWPARVGFLGERAALEGDAKDAASAWMGWVDPADPVLLEPGALVVDALFGAGLSRPLDGQAAALAAAARGFDTLCVDVPSGIHGDGAAPTGPHFRADVTATFVRKKPAHLLEPGRSACGFVDVLDIGTPDGALGGVDGAAWPVLWENHPDHWPLPWPGPETHKYGRGHVAVIGGPAGRTGAARLAARAALRAGAGVVTVVSPSDALAEYAAHLTAVMVTLEDAGEEGAPPPRTNAVVIGPALGVGAEAGRRFSRALGLGKPLVIDADAITLASEAPSAFFAAVPEEAVLTPHAGEFRRLFPDLEAAPRVDAVRRAAERAGCVVLLKGADTAIGAPDGRVVVNGTGLPFLATAGSGDVLAGIIAGLMAQGMGAFGAACAGAWLHGRAGERLGPGLIAEDLPETLPAILNDLAPLHLRRR